MKQIFSKEAKIGLVTIVSLVLLYFGINYLKGVNLFKPVNHYEVEFDNVNGVTISSPVYVEGFKVGLVREIRYDYEKMDKIIVDVSLDEKMRINKGSYITIVNSFLGGAELHIHLNKYVDDYLKPGDRVEGRMGEEMMQSVQEKILPSVQALVNHPALRQSLEHVERTTSNLEISTRRLNALMERDVPGIVADLKKITNDFSEVSGELKDLNLQQTFDHVNATLANLKVTTEKFNSTDNSLGLLLNDRALYDNLNSTAGNASKLLLDLREHPKRYVHFSVFGKKESSK